MVHGIFIIRNKEELEKLPEPGEEWQASEVDVHHGTLSKLSQREIIRVVGTNRHGNNVWVTDENAYAKITEYIG